MKRSKLFSDEDLKRVEAAVKEAEANTSGEIVTITVRQSAGYRWVRLLYGFLGGSVIKVIPAYRHHAGRIKPDRLLEIGFVSGFQALNQDIFFRLMRCGFHSVYPRDTCVSALL